MINISSIFYKFFYFIIVKGILYHFEFKSNELEWIDFESVYNSTGIVGSMVIFIDFIFSFRSEYKLLLV